VLGAELQICRHVAGEKTVHPNRSRER